MRYEEKLRREMILRGFNQQKLARLSGVSDSEVSRILSGQSQPGLENALRLARAAKVSLDYLADDTLEHDPQREPNSRWERDLFDLAREIGPREDAQILLSAQMLGPEWALLRLYGIDSEVLSGTSEILCPTDQNRRP